MKHLKTVVGIAVGALIILGFTLSQKWEIIDGNLHVTSKSFIKAWNEETKVWQPLIQRDLASSDSIRIINAEAIAELQNPNLGKTGIHQQVERGLITIYHTVETPKTNYNEFVTWVSLMLQNNRDYTRQEVVATMIHKKD